jgi:ribonuclease M5
MAEKLKIPYPVIVEGRYDKLRLQNVIEAQILTTDGFGMFNKTEKTKLFRALSQKTPIIVLTDSDGAGKLIRSYLTSSIPTDRLIQLYVPRIPGKERRKAHPSAEGVLGVEGMERELLLRLFAPYADAEAVSRRAAENPLSKTDLYIDGLTGGADSAKKRDELASRLDLPTGMNAGALLAALKIFLTYEEYLDLVGREAERSEAEN